MVCTQLVVTELEFETRSIFEDCLIGFVRTNFLVSFHSFISHHSLGAETGLLSVGAAVSSPHSAPGSSQ